MWRLGGVENGTAACDWRPTVTGRLAGKRALVTGGESGIGRAIAEAFAREGADVCVGYHRRIERAREVVQVIQSLGRIGCSIPVDLARSEEVVRLADEAWEQLGPIHILVNNAGMLIRRAFLETDLTDLDDILAVDLKAPFLLSRRLAEKMIASGIAGTIINVSSISQERAAPGLTAYQAAKGGLHMLTKGMALELAPFGIRVNALAPGFTLTEMNRDLWTDPTVLEARTAQVPLGRPGNPEDHVGAAVLLASDESTFMTGASVTVDGGITCR